MPKLDGDRAGRRWEENIPTTGALRRTGRRHGRSFAYDASRSVGPSGSLAAAVVTAVPTSSAPLRIASGDSFRCLMAFSPEFA